MEQLVISISPNGGVAAMHSDKFNLGFLGKRTIKRASDIKHNPDTDRWDIYMDNGDGLFVMSDSALQGFSQYEEARKFEVKWLNSCRLAGVAGNSVQGFVRAGVLRDSMNSHASVV